MLLSNRTAVTCAFYILIYRIRQDGPKEDKSQTAVHNCTLNTIQIQMPKCPVLCNVISNGN